MTVELRWEGTEKDQYLFAGDNPRELAWLEKRKVQWSAVCWLPGIDVGREFNTLAVHQKNLAAKVQHWFERALASQEVAAPSGSVRIPDLNTEVSEDTKRQLAAVDDALRAGAMLAKDIAVASPAAAPSEEPVAWLIELRGMVPTWWSLDYDNHEPHFTQDASKALRFARKQDADAYIDDIGWTEAFASEHMWDAVAPHSDDTAVDRFAAAMKAKLAKKREEGRGGWDGPDCSARILSDLLRAHVDKGDPLDVGNLAMMLHQRGERII